MSYRGRIKELERWARDAMSESIEEDGKTWKPSEDKWPKDKRPLYQASSIFTPIIYVHKEVAWTEPALDVIGLAMQAWRGEGYVSKLTGQKLKHYVSKPAAGPRTDGKTAPPPRYRTKAVVQVARLLIGSGSKLRQLLQITDASEAIPMHVVLAELEEQNVQLKHDLAIETASAKRLQKAWKTAAGRLKAKSKAVTGARRDERKKSNEKAKATVQEVKESCKRKVSELEATVRDDIRAEYDEKLSEARATACRSAKAAGLSKSRLKRLQETKDELDEIKQELEEVYEEMDTTDGIATREVLARYNSMPTWRRTRQSGRGGCAFDLVYRRSIYAQYANCTPRSAISDNIISIVKATAPWLNPEPVSMRTLVDSRFELRTIQESLAARKGAAAYRIRVLGSDETTKFGNAGITSNLLIEPTRGADLEVVVLRGAYISAGGTAEAIANAIELRCFVRGRDFLRRWEATCRRMYPQHKWQGPDPNRLSLARLAGGGAFQGDTCNTAQLTKEILADMVAEQKRREMGAEVWDALSEEERVHVTRTHKLDCWNHMRNIFLAPMSKAMAKQVATDLKQHLDAFTSWERMTTNFDQLLRACYKEFHHGNRYYKGKGREFWVWLKQNYPAVFVMHLERAEGGRQDLDYDAAVAMYIIRRYMVEFLHLHVFGADHSNILEDFLYITLSAVEYIAMLRANAIIDLLISRPLRFLSGSAYKLNNFSPLSLGTVGKKGALDITEEVMVRASTDGSILLDRSLDIYAPIRSEQPRFQEWHDHMFTKAHCLGPDNKTKHFHWKLALDEVLSPTDPTNACQAVREKTIQYIQVQCTEGLMVMRDKKRAIAHHLSSQDGDQAYNKNAQAHADCAGLDATNDRLAEGVFGIYDSVLRRFPGISMEAASAITQAVHAKSFVPGGHVDSLPPEEWHSLVEMARTTVREMRAVDKSHHASLDAYHAQRRKTNAEIELSALIKQYALALSFFDRWKERGVASPAALREALSTINTTQLKLDYLREQIEMRTIGLGFDEFKAKWSSSKDEDIGTVDDLTEHLKQILIEEAERQTAGTLPDAAVVPTMRRKTFKELGTATPQALELAGKCLSLPRIELLQRAKEERARLEELGELDRTADIMPEDAPPCDRSLIGKELEVRWRYWRPAREGERGQKKAVDIWCVGTVVQIANDSTDAESPKVPKKFRDTSAVKIMWPADADYDEKEQYTWSLLTKENWNKEAVLGWRYTAEQLAKLGDTHERARKRKK